MLQNAGMSFSLAAVCPVVQPGAEGDAIQALPVSFEVFCPEVVAGSVAEAECPECFRPVESHRAAGSGGRFRCLPVNAATVCPVPVSTDDVVARVNLRFSSSSARMRIRQRWNTPSTSPTTAP